MSVKDFVQQRRDALIAMRRDFHMYLSLLGLSIDLLRRWRIRLFLWAMMWRWGQMYSI